MKTPLPVLFLWLGGCQNKDTPLPNNGPYWPRGEADTDTDIDTDADADADADADTDVYAQAGLDEPGDVIEASPDGAGVVEISLADLSGDSNQDQAFYLLLINSGEGELGYELTLSAQAKTETAYLAREPLAWATPPATKGDARGSDAPTAGLSVGTDQQTFNVYNSLVDEGSREQIVATVHAVSDHVAVWVDDNTAIDLDSDCDGIVDVPAAVEAHGFDNCDLEIIADITEQNILATLEGTFGAISDVDGKDYLNVVITPEINTLPQTSDDEDVQGTFIGGYADPGLDLLEFSEHNPHTNETEVVFVFAPDPDGYRNAAAAFSTERYLDVELPAQIARAVFRLISFNQHVLIAGGEEEEVWVREGLAALAMDLTGFGAPLHRYIWDALDTAHLQDLSGRVAQEPIQPGLPGTQYLFFRWLADTAGLGTIAALVQTEQIDEHNIEVTTGQDMVDLVSAWQLALLTDSVFTVDGAPLLDSARYPSYTAPHTVNSGDLYGANGYQQGVHLRGINRTFTGGTASTAIEDEAAQVRLNHADAFLSAGGRPLYGLVAESWATHTVRITDVPHDAATLRIEGTTSDYRAVVVRWNELAPDIVVESSGSALDQSNLSLLQLPSDGTPTYALGALDGPQTVTTLFGGGTASESVSDTDRWVLDLSDRLPGESVWVAVWLERQYTDKEGTISLTDPWLALVPSELVPTPTASSVSSVSCPLGPVWAYPASVLEYLAYQVYLSGNSYDGAGTGVAIVDFDPCGDVSDSMACDEDWDRDGVADEDEPEPQSFLEQLLVHQCTLGGSMEGVIPLTHEIFDVDEIDQDEQATYSRLYDLGGNTSDRGEGAFLLRALSGGETYSIVVGGDVGGYTLVAQQVEL